VILPPFAPTSKISDRHIYNLMAADNRKYEPFTVASFIAVRDDFKLHYYFGYSQTPGSGLVHLYNINSDPEEMNDLASIKPETTGELLNELKTKLNQVNEPYL
jgi:hypothetical protein